MTTMTPAKMQAIIEAALMVAGYSLTIQDIQNLFTEEDKPNSIEIKRLLKLIQEQYEDSAIALREVASGYRLQAKAEYSPWLSKLWEERPPRYSRAFLETLSIIAYKQPITRAEIEEIRGVTVSTPIMKTLTEKEWVKVIGFKETPGKPAIYGTTKTFLDYFNLKALSDLPPLAEFKDFATKDSEIQVQLAIQNSNLGIQNSADIEEENLVVEMKPLASNDYE